VDERAADPETSPKADRPAAPDLQPAAKLFGRVLEEGSDIPVSGAAVTAYAFATGRTLRGTTGEDGTFDLHDAFAPGQVFQLVVRHEGLASASLRVVLSDGPVEIRLSGGGGIRGRVISAENGTPISPCRVCAVRMDDLVLDAWLLRSLLPVDMAVEAEATTGSGGGFEMAHVAPGAYALFTAAEGPALRAGRSVEVEAGSTAEVEIREPGTAPFFIDVIDEGSGEPLGGARFEVVGESIVSSLPAQYRGDGVYELRRGYRNGHFLGLFVRVRRDGFAPRILRVGGGSPGQHWRAALGRGAAITGHVRTATARCLAPSSPSWRGATRWSRPRPPEPTADSRSTDSMRRRM
jgi:hypothetical protein